MELKLVKTTYADLNSTARCVLALRNEPFFFVRMQDTLYMNKSMKGIRKVTAALETMWKYDYMENDEIMAEVDAAYDTIKNAAGEKAADKAWKAWGELAEESRKRRAKAEALEWIKTVYDKLDDPDWDEMYNAGFSHDFVEEGLWRAFDQLEEDDPERRKHRSFHDNDALAAFVYGFQLGRKAAEA